MNKIILFDDKFLKKVLRKEKEICNCKPCTVLRGDTDKNALEEKLGYYTYIRTGSSYGNGFGLFVETDPRLPEYVLRELRGKEEKRRIIFETKDFIPEVKDFENRCLTHEELEDLISIERN